MKAINFYRLIQYESEENMTATFAIILFLEGILTFISPCILPLLPVYVSYFLGDQTDQEENKQKEALIRVTAFILGFSIVFVSMGLLSGFIAQTLVQYKREIQLVAGGFVVITGLNMLGVFDKLKSGMTLIKGPNINLKPHSNSSRGYLVLFGAVFALGWTPCLSAYLGTALMMASQSGSSLQGGLLLLVYSLGLGLPFILSTYLLNSLKTTFSWIKNHFREINIFSAILMIIVGIAMMTGWVDYLQLLVQR